MFEIRLFGTPEVLWDGAPLSLQRRASRAMLFYLAAQGRAVRRDELIGLLWADVPLENGRSRLRETRSHLRDSLPAPELLASTPETLTLDFSQTRVDYLEFMRLSAIISNTPWRIPPEMPLPPSLYEMMNQLAVLYRLPGFMETGDADFSGPMREWRDNINTTARGITLRCLDRLYEHASVALGEEAALQYLTTAIGIDRFDDARQERFLAALLKAGHKQQARQHYQALETAYRKDLDLPLPGGIAALQKRVFEDSQPSSQNVLTWPLRPTLKAPFVGRESSLGDLRRNFVSGGGVIVFGEAGAGKTRLVQEFVQRLEPAPRLLLGVCRPMASNLPFQPWVDMLRRSIREAEWQALPAPWVVPIARLLPELIEVRPDLAARRSEFEHPKNVFFEAVRQLLLSISARDPLIIFMDDVHWADESSLGLLAYLLEQGFFTGRHGFLILASRIEESNTSLHRLLSASYLNRINPIQLGQLSAEEIGQLVHHVLREAPPAGFVERLSREVGGNPFIILETIGAFLDRPIRPNLSEITRLPLVSSVNQMILARLRMVSPEGREVLHAAAIYGGSLKVGMLSQVVSLPEETVAHVFEELERLHFIHRETLDGTSDYVFVHEKFRESLLQDISPAHNYLFNRRIAEVMEERLDAHGMAQAAVIAQHFEAAGLFAPAFDYWLKAAHYAYGLASMGEAASLYKRAERLIARIPNLDDDKISALFISWSDMAYGENDPDTLFRINRMLLAVGEERGSNLLLGMANYGLSNACWAANQLAEGLDYAARSLHYLESTDNQCAQMEARNRCGNFLFLMGRLDESEEQLGKTIAQSEDAHEPQALRARALAFYQVSIIHTLRGFPREGLRHGQAALDVALRLRWSYGKAAAFSALGTSAYYMGNYAEGLRSCLQGIELAERQDGWRILSDNHLYASHLATELGRLGEAWTHAQKALEIGERYHHAEIISLAHKATGDIYRRLRAYRQSVEAYRRGIQAGGEHFSVVRSMYRLGVVLAELDDPEGLPLVQRAIRTAESAGLMTFACCARILRLRVLIDHEQYDLYERETADLRPLLRERLFVDGAWLLDLTDAHKLARLGQPRQAFERLDDILSQCEGTSWFWLGMRARAMKVTLGRQLGLDVSDVACQLDDQLEQIGAGLDETSPLYAHWQAMRTTLPG